MYVNKENHCYSQKKLHYKVGQFNQIAKTAQYLIIPEMSLHFCLNVISQLDKLWAQAHRMR